MRYVKRMTAVLHMANSGCMPLRGRKQGAMLLAGNCTQQAERAARSVVGVYTWTKHSTLDDSSWLARWRKVLLLLQLGCIHVQGRTVALHVGDWCLLDITLYNFVHVCACAWTTDDDVCLLSRRDTGRTCTASA